MYDKSSLLATVLASRYTAITSQRRLTKQAYALHKRRVVKTKKIGAEHPIWEYPQKLLLHLFNNLPFFQDNLAKPAPER